MCTITSIIKSSLSLMHQARHDSHASSSLKLASGSELAKASFVGDRQGRTTASTNTVML